MPGPSAYLHPPQVLHLTLGEGRVRERNVDNADSPGTENPNTGSWLVSDSLPDDEVLFTLITGSHPRLLPDIPVQDRAPGSE